MEARMTRVKARRRMVEGRREKREGRRTEELEEGVEGQESWSQEESRHIITCV